MYIPPYTATILLAYDAQFVAVLHASNSAAGISIWQSDGMPLNASVLDKVGIPVHAEKS